MNEHPVETNGSRTNRGRHRAAMSIGVAAWLLALPLPAPGSPAQGPIPDSPTGRMAGALVELTDAPGEEALQEFVRQHLPAAGQGSTGHDLLVARLRQLRSGYPDARLRGLLKTGPHSGQIVLHSEKSGRDGTVSYEVEPDPPNHLKSLVIEEGDGGHFTTEAHQPPPPRQRASSGGAPREGLPPALEGRLRGFVETFNSGDAEMMLAFIENNMTTDFQKRRTDEEDRALYERLRDMIGELRDVELSMDGLDVKLTATTSDHGDHAELLFDIEEAPPHRIQSYTVSIERGRPAETLPALAMPDGIDRQEFSARLDRYLAGLARDDRFSGSVLVAREGEPLFDRAYGLANRGTGAANLPGTMFDLGSITKIFTRTAIGQLLRDGRITLDDTVLEHIPDYPNRDAGGRITIAHLLDHASGLGDIFSDRFRAMRTSLLRPRDYFPLFAGDDLAFEPGQGEQYSNAGYVLLGAIVEAVSGRSYDDYVRDNIFAPAGMERSGFVPRDGSKEGVAIGYSRGGPESDSGEGELRSSSEWLPVRGCPAGSSASSSGDLLKFARALRGGLLLGPDWTTWIYTGRLPGVADPDAPPSARPDDFDLSIAGGAPGVNSALLDGSGWTVIVLANLDPPIAEEVARTIRRAALHLPD